MQLPFGLELLVDNFILKILGNKREGLVGFWPGLPYWPSFDWTSCRNKQNGNTFYIRNTSNSLVILSIRIAQFLVHRTMNI